LAKSEALERLKTQISQSAGTDYNSCLIIIYPDGNSKMGDHFDKETDIEKDTIISTYSVGEVRDIEITNAIPPHTKARIALPHNSVVEISPSLNEICKHGIPRMPSVKNPRISFTWRKITTGKQRVEIGENKYPIPKAVEPGNLTQLVQELMETVGGLEARLDETANRLTTMERQFEEYKRKHGPLAVNPAQHTSATRTLPVLPPPPPLSRLPNTRPPPLPPRPPRHSSNKHPHSSRPNSRGSVYKPVVAQRPNSRRSSISQRDHAVRKDDRRNNPRQVIIKGIVGLLV